MNLEKHNESWETQRILINAVNHEKHKHKVKKKEEPDDVNDFTKSLAHILNFESLYCPYYILFYKWRYIF